MLKKTGGSRWVAATVVLGLVVLVTYGVLYASGGEGGHRASVTPEKLKDLLWRTQFRRPFDYINKISG